MPTNRLTELAVRNAKCVSKRKKLSDGGSMYLELHPNGGKDWRMNYQFQKKEKTLALGVWPPPYDDHLGHLGPETNE